MCNKRIATVAGILSLAMVCGTGCVTTKKFRKNVERTDSRIIDVESSVETNERRLGDLKGETDRKVAELERETAQALRVGDEAKDTAEQAALDADKALKGRLIWNETLSDDKVKFSVNRANLSNDGKEALDGLIGKIKSYGKAVFIEIEGHTDSTGDAIYNAKLSEERAQIVRNYLNEQGIPLHAMNVIGHGENKPVADNKSQNGRAQNRRVVIKVLE